MILKRKAAASSKIPTCTTADLVFIMLIFFMSTTLFKEEGGLSIRFPQAHPEIMSNPGTQALTLKVWIKQLEPGNDESELVARVGDFDLPIRDIPAQLRILTEKLWREQNKSVDAIVFNIDQRVPMRAMVDLFNSLRYEELYSVIFNAEESSGGM
jgi:biopolymer transport protein ExbD